MYSEKSTAYVSEGAIPVKQTAIGAANATFEQAMALSERVRDICGRLVGPVPETDQSIGKGISSGILPSLHDYADSARSRIQMAHAALDQLERSL